MFDWLRNWRQRRTRRNEYIVFLKDVARMKKFREAVQKQACPACNQKKLEVDLFSDGAKGWGARIRCTNCNFKGEVNVLGFNVLNITSKGQAVQS